MVAKGRKEGDMQEEEGGASGCGKEETSFSFAGLMLSHRHSGSSTACTVRISVKYV